MTQKCPLDRTVQGAVLCSVFLLGGVAVLVAGGTVAAAAFAFPAALLGDPDHCQANSPASTRMVMIPRSVSIEKTSLFALECAISVYTIAQRSNCPAVGKIAKKSKLGLPIHFGCGIILLFRFGGLAQLVRAPASHAGGLGFESLILHHTVRTRTRFFTRKGSGTFFVYRKFCGGSTQSGKRERVKAGYHHGRWYPAFCFAGSSSLCANLVVHPIWRIEANRCVRPYMAGTHVRRKKGKVLTYRGVLSAGSMVYSAQQIGS